MSPQSWWDIAKETGEVFCSSIIASGVVTRQLPLA
jgi:hypothetical protein